jgi:hypothetical protein
MDASPAASNGTGSGKLYSELALGMLAAVAGTCSVLVALASYQPLEDWMRRTHWEQTSSKKSLPIFCFTGHFVDTEERLLHDAVPGADYSRGGVYFFGASSMQWAIKTWDLASEAQPLIHNFGLGGSKHGDMFDMIRFLVEDEGLLKAGGEKTLVVFGLNYRLCHHSRLLEGGKQGKAFTSNFTRHGFYQIEPDGSIHRSGLNAIAKRMIIERTKMTGLLRELVNIAYTPVKPMRVHDRPLYSMHWRESMGPRWQELIPYELNALAQAIDYLQQHKAKVAVVLFPMGSWEDGEPFAPVYNQRMRELCESAGVPLYDFSKLVDDEDFADSDHLAPSGVEKFQRAVMGFCLDHLRSSGALPASDSPAKS